ncbi:MAG: hypothetical protein ACJA01_003713, partial [Saprospiraceae bacterium]
MLATVEINHFEELEIIKKIYSIIAYSVVLLLKIRAF